MSPGFRPETQESKVISSTKARFSGRGVNMALPEAVLRRFLEEPRRGRWLYGVKGPIDGGGFIGR